jgi:serpin B
VKQVVADGNAFAFDLYGRLRDRPGNLSFSPASVSPALAMTFAGARGTTRDQMAGALHFTLRGDRLQRAFAGLLRDFNSGGSAPAGRGYQLTVANALWGQAGIPWQEPFQVAARQHYGAGLHPVDFAGAGEEARQVINRWVEAQTQDKVKDLLPPGAVGPRTRLVLTNAVYFKGRWAVPFDKKDTREEAFNLPDRRQVPVPMMNRTGEYPLYEDAEVQVLSLPYAGEGLSMFVLLPPEGQELADVEKKLTAAQFGWWAGRARERKVVVTLPKFRTTAEVELAAELRKLGMTDAFGPAADFSGMGGKKGELYISTVRHKARVEVSEEGTEAAAATAVGFHSRSLAPGRPPVFVFRANRPFVFAIRDNRSGAVLFLGRVDDPRS